MSAIADFYACRRSDCSRRFRHSHRRDDRGPDHHHRGNAVLAIVVAGALAVVVIVVVAVVVVVVIVVVSSLSALTWYSSGGLHPTCIKPQLAAGGFLPLPYRTVPPKNLQAGSSS